MTEVVCDASIVLKWFHAEGETDVDDARLLLAAHAAGTIDAVVLDLTFYEIGNVLTRGLRWPAREVADQLDDLELICGTGMPLTSDVRGRASELAGRHGLSFYDAAYAAAAQVHAAPLATADDALLTVGLGERPAALAQRLALRDR